MADTSQCSSYCLSAAPCVASSPHHPNTQPSHTLTYWIWKADIHHCCKKEITKNTMAGRQPLASIENEIRGYISGIKRLYDPSVISSGVLRYPRGF